MKRFTAEFRAAAVMAAVLALAAGCGSRPSYYKGDMAALPDSTPVAILPLVNLTPDVNAPDIVMNAVMVELLASGRFHVVDPGRVEQAIENERVRFSDRLPPETLHTLATALGVKYVFVGTVSDFGFVRETGLDIPIVSFALRMIDCNSGNIIWAATHSKRGDDSEKLFTLGRIDTLEELTTVAAREMTQTMFPDKVKTNNKNPAAAEKTTP